MLTHAIRTGALAALLTLCAAPANAVVVTGTYSGTVTSGHADGAFGFTTRSNVTGMSVAGSFTYDLANATSCGRSPWYARFSLPGAMTIVQTLNGFTETFSANAPPAGSPSYNVGAGGVAHDRLTIEGIELAVRSALGAPSTVFDQYEIHLGAYLPSGRTWPDYLADGKPSWDGTVSSGGAGGVQIPDLSARINETLIYQLTAGGFTKDARFRFELEQITMGPLSASVPEPGTWTMLILGLGFVGASVRRSRQRAAGAERAIFTPSLT